MKDQANSPLNLLLQQIDQRRSAVDALRPFTSDLEGRIMQKFRLDWNYHSNAIEGNALTYGETIAFLMEGLTAKGKPIRDYHDIEGHNAGIDFLMHFVEHSNEFNQKAILELHEIILVKPYKKRVKSPSGLKFEKWIKIGKYKTDPNHVETPTGEIHYYATPEETPAKMTDLMDWLRQHQEKNDLSPLELAAIFHYKFVAIHPFDDGNGRMSRLLMNLLLMQYGYPPVVIKQQDRQAYYYALRQADAGEMNTFVEYIGENLLHSLEIQLKGARGESMEEPDDLDKEIALLKGSLGEEEIVPKSAEVVRTLLSTKIVSLFKDIQKQCLKLDELFFNKWERLQYAKDGEPYKKTISPIEWNEVNIQLLSDDPITIAQATYEYHWTDFRRIDNPFSLHLTLSVFFNDFNYEIIFGGPNEPRNISKPYAQKLTPEEFTDLSKIFVREALEQIKARTGK